MIVALIGWIGSVCVVIAYALTIKQDRRYISICNYLNLFGAGMVAYNCYINTSFPSLFLNIMWFGIAIIGIITNQKNKQ